MKTILAYRNNQTYQALSDAIATKASSIAQKKSSVLVTKVFEFGTEHSVIDAWIQSLSGSEIVHYVVDGTVADRLTESGVKLEYGNSTDLTQYVQFGTGSQFMHVSIDELYRTCYSRLAESIKPDQWIIIWDNISDYDPLGLNGGMHGDWIKFASEEKKKYADKIKEFIPAGQQVTVCSYSDYELSPWKDKKVVIIAHHHAMQHLKGYGRGRDGSGTPIVKGHHCDGSLWLNSYPSSFMSDLVGVIQTDDLIGENWMAFLRKEILERH